MLGQDDNEARDTYIFSYSLTSLKPEPSSKDGGLCDDEGFLEEQTTYKSKARELSE